MVVWCFTGGGDLFEENLKAFITLLSKENLPILAIFSRAGALVQNRFGFFWKLQQLKLNSPQTLFLFEDATVLTYNIDSLLKKAQISFGILPFDPTFSRGIWLANQDIRCIIASPLTANSAAKLATGISDTLIVNLLSAGRKAKQRIGIFPTDRFTDVIISKLPVRQKKPLHRNMIDYKACSFYALHAIDSTSVEYRPEYCVGCQKCVQLYPEYFSVGEIVEIHIRKTDQMNTQKLSNEFRVFQSPDEISTFVTSS